MRKLRFIMLLGLLTTFLIACSGGGHPLELTQRIIVGESLTVGFPDCWIASGDQRQRYFTSDSSISPNSMSLESGQVVMIFKESDIPARIPSISFSVLRGIALLEAEEANITNADQLTAEELWIDEVMAYTFTGTVRNRFGEFGGYIITGFDTVNQKLFTAIALTVAGEEQDVAETVKVMMTSLEPATDDALMVQAPLPERCASDESNQQAQASTQQQTFTNGVTLTFPEGWAATEQEGMILLANNEDFANMLDPNMLTGNLSSLESLDNVMIVGLGVETQAVSAEEFEMAASFALGLMGELMENSVRDSYIEGNRNISIISGSIVESGEEARMTMIMANEPATNSVYTAIGIGMGENVGDIDTITREILRSASR